MLIDGFTVFAQLINFLILMWLLKRFLYKPILDVIAKREEIIQNQIHDAEQQKILANKVLAEFQQKNNEFDQHRQQSYYELSEQVKTERQQLLARLHNEIELARFHLNEMLQNEYQALSVEFKKRIRDELFAIVRKTLSNLADADLESQLIKLFFSQISQQNDEEKKRFTIAVSQSDEPMILKTFFSLSIEQQENVIQQIHSIFNCKHEVIFEQENQLISGLVLSVNGYQLSWNMDAYLQNLQDEVGALLMK